MAFITLPPVFEIYFSSNVDGIVVGLWTNQTTDGAFQLLNEESIEWIVNTIAMDFASLHQTQQESLEELDGNKGLTITLPMFSLIIF